MTAALLDAMRPAHHGSYAHFPGSGPGDKTCRDCRWCHGGGSRWYCGKHAELIRSLGLPKKQRPISRSTEACRYFEPAN